MIFDYFRKALGWNRLYIGSSGGSSSTQQFTPPSYTVDAWKQYMNRATDLSNQPQQVYGGQTIADLNGQQLTGMDLISQTALKGSPDTNAARGQITDTNRGMYLGTNPWLSPTSALGQTASGGFLNSNPYLSNEYSSAVINDNALNMANSFRLGTAAQTDAAFARQGAFGGSAYDQMVANNAQGLAQSVGQMANQARLAQQGLQSADYGRERGLMQNAAQTGVQDYQGERANMMAAAPLGLQGQGLDFQAGQALSGVGDVYRTYEQDLLNQGLGAFNQQQQYPFMQLDALGNALARTSGNVAGGSTSTLTQPYSASPIAGLLGTGLAAYGLFGK